MADLSMGKFSLRNRIFVSMLSITSMSLVLMALISLYQYKKEAKAYHQDRLLRKENSINEHLSFILNNTSYDLTEENLPLIFKDRIFELSSIHDIQINIHDLDGRLLISSKSNFIVDEAVQQQISPIILRIIESSPSKRFVDLRKIDDQVFRTAYNYIINDHFKNLGIVSIPYREDTTFYDAQMEAFLIYFSQACLFLFALSILFSFMLSNTITRSIKDVSDYIGNTKFHKKNQKIASINVPNEIHTLIIAYNNMVDELERSADLLAKSERENAWREMAKQVAHEIKNPLTPMRLTVQMFDRKFDPDDPKIKEKMKDFCDTLIQQIDTMTSVASAFSNFASMPAQENETIDLVKVVQLSLEIFNEDFIYFSSQEEEIIGTFDKTQIVRVVTNLVKNAIQAIPNYRAFPEISVDLKVANQHVYLHVSDNGEGISEENLERIFEPKFTTKSSGMGLGLAMIKNIIESYGGNISVSSQIEKGTKFTVVLPIK